MLLKIKDKESNNEYHLYKGLDGEYKIVAVEEMRDIVGNSFSYYKQNKVQLDHYCLLYGEDSIFIYVQINDSVYKFRKDSEGNLLIKFVSSYIENNLDLNIENRKVGKTNIEMKDVAFIYYCIEEETGKIKKISTDIGCVSSTRCEIYKCTPEFIEVQKVG